MKKIIFFVAAILLTSSSLMAQMKFETGNLTESIAKAKSENKLVMIMVSSTW